ncbi:MAG: aminotransferase class I/II-fold pyridoxal phosphate-dependent enzyme [Jaaginema sp. PMC 1080.18]|nr:aminotransferase class I/II-fold pyridoxal phosphate-dependent enzyme [Jaaginema sp. PMC 1080.18]MEC4866425.1 aminotransferase class I/II-fold pyridoxal phosphate-dependent enzyme [Jaaginema sp. PMC 1078.18]
MTNIHLPPTVKTIVDLLAYQGSNKPHKTAYTFLVDGEKAEISYTYQQLETRVKAIAAYLQQHSQKGDRVLLLYPTGLEYCAAFFACLYAGLIAVPAYPPRRRRSPTRLLNIYQDAQPTLALTESTLLTQIEQHFATASTLHCIASDTITNDWASQWQSRSFKAADLAFLQYTSGSTAAPKGVMISHENLLCNSQFIYTHFSHCSDSKGVIWLPPYHDMGLVGGLIQSVYCGASTVLMSAIDFLQKPLRWLQAISTYQATTSGGPDFAYDLCVQKFNPEELENLDLSSWEVAFNGAEAIRVETLNHFAETFAPYGFKASAFYPCYGMAEATLLIAGKGKKELVVDAIAPENSPEQLLVSCGYGAEDHEIIIVDPHTLKPCPGKTVGEIWLAGKSVAEGYWQKPQLTQAVFAAQLENFTEKQFLRTGDLGVIKAGELFVTGRLKDMIIIRGKNYYPQDIEQTVESSHPTLRPYHIAAFATPVEGQEKLVIVAEINRKDRRNFDKDAVFQAIRTRISLAYSLQVYAIALVKPETLPKTSSGKLQRYLCREQFQNQDLTILAAWQLSPSDSDSNFSALDVAEIQQWLTQWLARKTGITPLEIKPDITLAEYGIDSLVMTELSESLRQNFHITVNFADFDDFPTIASFATYLATHQKQLHFSEDQNTAAPTSAEIPLSSYHFEHFPEYQALQQQRSQIEALGVDFPFFRSQQNIARDTIQIDNRNLINYATYNYLGLSGDAEITEAVQTAIATYGTSVSASRLVSGQIPLHQALETEIAQFLKTEKSLVYVGGHATNVTTISHLMKHNDLILYDSLSHNSLIRGAIHSGATAIAFPHNNWQALEQQLSQIRHRYRRVLIIIEGVYSTDGDIPDLPQFITIKQRHQALLMVDEAHSIGVLGNNGRGISEYFGICPATVDIWMGTLSKSLASCGGYIAGNAALIDYLKYTAPGFVYSVGMSPANTAAALASLRKLQAEPQRIAQLHQRVADFLSLAKSQGIAINNSQKSPIIPFIVGESSQAIKLSHNLFQQGINVPFMIYPAVPKNTARLRFFVSCLHTKAQIEQTIQSLTKELAKLA